MEKFIVKHYVGDRLAMIKGNGLDGLALGECREDLEDFIKPINELIDQNKRMKKVFKKINEYNELDCYIYSLIEYALGIQESKPKQENY